MKKDFWKFNGDIWNKKGANKAKGGNNFTIPHHIKECDAEDSDSLSPSVCLLDVWQPNMETDFSSLSCSTS